MNQVSSRYYKVIVFLISDKNLDNDLAFLSSFWGFSYFSRIKVKSYNSKVSIEVVEVSI